MRTKLTLIATGLAFSGCTFLPVANYNRETVIQEAIDKKDQPLGKDRALTLENARFLAVGWRDRLESAAVTKRNQTLVAEEVLYYGTLLLTGAQMALTGKGAGGMERDLRHIRNIAGTAALGSTLFSEHYKTGEQQPMFEKAAARMRCVTDVLADVQDEVRAQWPDDDFFTRLSKDKTPISKLYDDIPRQVVDFVERKSVPELRAALSSITVGTPTRAELIKTIQQYKDDQTQAANDAPKTLLLDPTIPYKKKLAAKLMAKGMAPDKARATAQAFVNNPTRSQTDLVNTLVENGVTADNANAAAADFTNEPPQSQLDLEAQTKFIVAVSSFSTSLQTCGVTYTQ